MKSKRNIVVAAALLASVAMSGAALAQRGPGHYGGHGGWHYGHGYGGVGAVIGGAIVAGALLSPWYYPGPYYYPYPAYPAYPTVVNVAPPEPTVYVQQPQAAPAAAPDAGNWWYYCNDSKAYYPYVRECASPWQRVSPTPQAAR